MRSIEKLTKNGKAIFPATTTDAVVHPEVESVLTDLIEYYNISILFPTGGANGGNRYNLTLALSRLDSRLSDEQKHLGVKLSFVGVDDKFYEYTYIGQGGFNDINSWARSDIGRLIELEDRFESGAGEGIPDAPQDGCYYSRCDGRWVTVNTWNEEL